jgi:hypothetical protein
MGVRLGSKEGSASFLKKSKKLSLTAALARLGQTPAGAKVFLLLFFSKKEALTLFFTR